MSAAPVESCTFELEGRYHSGRCDRMCTREPGHRIVVHRCSCGVTVPVEGSPCRHERIGSSSVHGREEKRCTTCGLRMDVFPGDPEDDALDETLAAPTESEAWRDLGDAARRGLADGLLEGAARTAPRATDAWDELYSSGEVPPDTSLVCCAPAPHSAGLVCSRPAGHPGWHEASDGEKVLMGWAAVDPLAVRLWRAVEFVRSMRPFELPDDAVVSLPVAHVRALLEGVHDQRRDMATVDGYLKAAAERTHAPRPLGEYR